MKHDFTTEAIKIIIANAASQESDIQKAADEQRMSVLQQDGHQYAKQHESWDSDPRGRTLKQQQS